MTVQEQLTMLQEDINQFHRSSDWLKKLKANEAVNDTSDGVIAEHIDRMREALRRQTKQLNAIRLLVLATQQIPLWEVEPNSPEGRAAYREEYERQKMMTCTCDIHGWD